MANSYDGGSTIRISNVSPTVKGFVRLDPVLDPADGTLVDPPAVHLVVWNTTTLVDLVAATYTQGSGDPSSTIIRDSVGIYHALVVPLAQGTYRYRWYAPPPASYAASAQNYFIVVTDVQT